MTLEERLDKLESMLVLLVQRPGNERLVFDRRVRPACRQSRIHGARMVSPRQDQSTKAYVGPRRLPGLGDQPRRVPPLSARGAFAAKLKSDEAKGHGTDPESFSFHPNTDLIACCSTPGIK